MGRGRSGRAAVDGRIQHAVAIGERHTGEGAAQLVFGGVAGIIEQSAQDLLAEGVLRAQHNAVYSALIIVQRHVGEITGLPGDRIAETFQRKRDVPVPGHLAFSGLVALVHALQFAVRREVVAELVIFGRAFNEQTGDAGKVFIDHANVFLGGFPDLLLTNTFDEGAFAVLDAEDAGDGLNCHGCVSL